VFHGRKRTHARANGRKRKRARKRKPRIDPLRRHEMSWGCNLASGLEAEAQVRSHPRRGVPSRHFLALLPAQIDDSYRRCGFEPVLT
jgi:hypothetical protein